MNAVLICWGVFTNSLNFAPLADDWSLNFTVCFCSAFCSGSINMYLVCSTFVCRLILLVTNKASIFFFRFIVYAYNRDALCQRVAHRILFKERESPLENKPMWEVYVKLNIESNCELCTHQSVNPYPANVHKMASSYQC
jgi:hypothetical protein